MASVIPKEAKKEVADTYIAEATADDWYACLLTSAFTYVSGTHIKYADISGSEVVGTGYTAGGKQVTPVGLGYVDTTNYAIDAGNILWTTATFANVRYVVIYNYTSGNIRAIYDLGSDYSVTAGTFTVQWNPGGIIKISS